MAIDPVRGRIAFPSGQISERGVVVSYYYGFSADIGGGEYVRSVSQPAESRIFRVGNQEEME